MGKEILKFISLLSLLMLLISIKDFYKLAYCENERIL